MKAADVAVEAKPRNGYDNPDFKPDVSVQIPNYHPVSKKDLVTQLDSTAADRPAGTVQCFDLDGV